MISLEDVLKIRKELYEESTALIAAKGHDYNRSQQDSGDTLFNLRVAALLGVVDSPAKSVMVRLIDKIMRMISLTDADPKVKGESIRDTVKDLHNYADYWYMFLMEAKNEQPTPEDKAYAKVYTEEAQNTLTEFEKAYRHFHKTECCGKSQEQCSCELLNYKGEVL
jgi:hypothetical protein